ncbi:MAG: Ribonuclease T [Chlamydiae bacterium]|nr:Ribonuclease T [Chlamydiota bacterium]
MLGIFLDTETNGLNATKHRLIEIACKIVDVQTGTLKDQYEAVVFVSFEEWKKSDPESLKVNGFSWADVKDGKKLSVIAEEIKASFKSCGIQRNEAVFICQNPSFDRVFFTQVIDADMQEQLNWPYHWLDLASMYWMRCILDGAPNPWETGVSKNKIAAVYNLPPEAHPHKAMHGVDHLIDCYKAVVGFPG